MHVDADVAKKFLDWIKVKIFIHISDREIYFKDAEIWWASIGHNIGTESNGKNDTFERPVLIFKKFSRDSFWGIVISSQVKSGPYYYPFRLKKRRYYINLSQLRLLSSKRLLRHIGSLEPTDFIKIRNAIKNLT